MGLLNLKTYSFTGLPTLQGPPGPGTHPAVGGGVTGGGVTFPSPVEKSVSWEDALAWMLYPRTDAQALGNRGQTQGTDSAPLPLSLPMFGVSEN